MELNLGSLLLISVALVLIEVRFWHHALTPERLGGNALLVLSFILLATARLQLGKAFSVKPEAHSLVTTGLYSRIRNPIYIFGNLMLAGLALALGIRWALLGFLVLIPLQVQQSRKEAHLLAERFGSEYESYKRGTWF